MVAEFRSMANEFQGPNEAKTAEILSAKLPNGWLVIHSKILDVPNFPEIDFVILSMNHVFVIEEKSWGPGIHLGEAMWTVKKKNNKSEERKNPFFGVAHKAKVLASTIQKIPGYSVNVRGQRILPAVILTHPELSLSLEVGRKTPEHLYVLDDVVEQLIKFDSENVERNFQAHRKTIKAVLLAENPHRPQLPLFEGYKTLYEIAENNLPLNEKKVRVFAAENTVIGGLEHLRCYVKQHCQAEGLNFRKFEERERNIVEKLAYTRRLWSMGNVFESHAYNYFVTCSRKPEDVVSMTEVISGVENVFEDSDYLSVFLSVAIDAFKTISEISREGIFHRALHPNRIWIGKGLKVTFSDFYISKIASEATIKASEIEDISSAYRAPEWISVQQAAEGSKEPESNVKIDTYALSKALRQWLVLSETKIDEKIKQKIDEILLANLAEDSSKRPEISESILALEYIRNPDAAPAPDTNQLPETPDLESEIDFGNLFQVQKLLGIGGSAKTYLVDYKPAGEIDSLPMIVKHAKTNKDFRDMENESLVTKEIYEVISAEFRERIATAKFYDPTPEPGTLKLNYVRGIPLSEFIQNGIQAGSDELEQLFLSGVEILSLLHKHKFVHGDVSPKNLLVDDQEMQINLIDFGCARNLSKIRTPERAGTPKYWSPEASAGLEISPASDIYSLAASFINILLGRSHRKFQLGDAENAFDVQPLVGAQRHQWNDRALKFFDLLFQCVDKSPIKRPSSEEITSRLRAFRLEPIPVIVGGTEKQNQTVMDLRRVYTAGKMGAGGAIAERGDLSDSDRIFGERTFVETLLEKELIPYLEKKVFKALLLTGNPGGGKTAFLNKFAAILSSSGAEKIQSSIAGWEMNLKGEIFIGINDASASNGEKTSDENIKSSLKKAYESEARVLLAINDGKLKQFFMDYYDEFPEWAQIMNEYRLGKSFDRDGLIILDLKERSMMDFEGKGIFSSTIEKFTKKELWEPCNTCSSKPLCPIYENQVKISSKDVKSKLIELVRFYSLRRIEKLNIRRIRSALSFLITGDLSCDEVHEIAKSPLRHSELNNYLLHNLLFNKDSGDSLIRAISEYDPSRRISPELRERILTESLAELDSLELAQVYGNQSRIALLDFRAINSTVPLQDLEPYRYGSEFIDYLSGVRDQLDNLLKGLSQISGLMIDEGNGLVIAESKANSGWKVAKVIPSSDFKIELQKYESRFIESVPEYLVLTHVPSNKMLSINIDAFETIMRAADGEVFQDTTTRAIRSELLSFQSAILRNPHHTAEIISPDGKRFKVSLDEGKKISLTEMELL